MHHVSCSPPCQPLNTSTRPCPHAPRIMLSSLSTPQHEHQALSTCTTYHALLPVNPSTRAPGPVHMHHISCSPHCQPLHTSTRPCPHAPRIMLSSLSTPQHE